MNGSSPGGAATGVPPIDAASAPAAAPPPVLLGVRDVFRSVAETVVPESVALDATGWAAVEEIVERALAARPERMRRQLRLLLRVIDLLPVWRFGSRFSKLDITRRVRVLARLQDSRVYLLRRGFWGLRTLVFMGYYARPEAGAEIGYTAHPRGWDVRR